MKFRLIIIVLICVSSISYGQVKAFDFSKLTFKGQEIILSKDVVIKTFGQGEIKDPQYECGFYSNDQPGAPYYQISFDSFNYIGSDSEKFILEHVNFNLYSDLSIQYEKWTLNGQTTKADLIKIFGDNVETYFANNPELNDILIHNTNGDDGVIFSFKENRLIRFQYWSPC
ncbi:hypothetical protein MY04_4412 [Flammeovirga sp. MY04]|uniref:hypothetical protein n=1 Tax=Flammeovirga sp. MY04 TaxID=1191459 RepID=UPI0008063169|nr:hypothetical protein [Flammeovirga sp. MY04]ANQ51750.1 hypothetical protein MY04_4412 [Flammeovirga sp. MY04]